MEWIEYHLFTCAFKAITGWDCPGCGFQRSLLSLLRGDIQDSLSFYPATIPILLLFLWSIIRMRYTFEASELITRSLILLSASTVTISYAVKLVSISN